MLDSETLKGWDGWLAFGCLAIGWCFARVRAFVRGVAVTTMAEKDGPVAQLTAAINTMSASFQQSLEKLNGTVAALGERLSFLEGAQNAKCASCAGGDEQRPQPAVPAMPIVMPTMAITSQRRKE